MSDSQHPVRNYMITTVDTLQDDARLLDAALLIRRTGKRHVPIVSAVDGKIAGIISDRDVARLAPSMLANQSEEEYNAIFEGTVISKVMTKNPMTLPPDATMAEAANLMHSMKIGCVLVAEEGRLKGILTISDMLSLLQELLGGGEKPFDMSAG